MQRQNFILGNVLNALKQMFAENDGEIARVQIFDLRMSRSAGSTERFNSRGISTWVTAVLFQLLKMYILQTT